VEDSLLKIIVGYDGGPASNKALEVAIDRAKGRAATIYPLLSLHGEQETEAAQVVKARQVLEKAQLMVQAQGIACDPHLLIRGMDPGEDIVKFAEDHGVDEIVMGVRRRSNVGKLLFGSNAQFVILNAPCPVTTVR
jgi:nucleotide-binding universal stress UspA family protein